MLTFFDSLYYSIYKLYKGGNDDSPEFAASCAIAGFQTFNITSIIMLYGICVERNLEMNISKIFGGALIVALIILNYIRYIWMEKFNYEVIKAKLELKSFKQKKKNRLFRIIYVFTTLLLFFSLIFYFAIKKM